MAGRRIGFWYRVAVVVCKPLLMLFTHREWRGLQHLPATGGVIVAANHHAYADPLTVAHALYDAGRLPRFLAKVELFHVPLIGQLLRGAGQIPVHRGTSDASAALADAVAALRRGEVVVIYPEGTVTRDPQLWPMRGKTGVARLALESGAPVLPLAQWGAQVLYERGRGPHLTRAHVVTELGAPVDLSAVRDRPITATTLREATDLIMGEIRRLVGELRGVTPPDQLRDAPQSTGGNP